MKRYVMFACVAVLVLIVLTISTRAQFGGFFGPIIQDKEIATRELIKLQETQRTLEEQAGKQGKPEPVASFIIVDVRSVAETKVSLIPGAITKDEFEKNFANYKNRTIIAYCTVGGRSGRYAQQLAKNGNTVFNYKGSILEWCREQQPLVTPDGKPTNRVHTYSSNYKVPMEYQPIY